MGAEIQLGWNNGKLQAGAAGAAAIVNKASAQMKGALSSIGQGLGVGAGFAIFDTLKNTVTGSISSIAEATVKLDSMRLGMTVLEGSTEAANARLQEMRELAKLPGLGFEQAVEGDIRLRSAGISASISKRAIEEMGNALASVGKGKADMDGVILALSQIASKGKVSAEEINQIAERVPQIRAILKGTFGTADTEAIQKMGIPVERFISMVVEGFEKTVPRAMIGLRGGWENLTDAMTAAAAGFGESIGESLLAPMDGATAGFEDNAEKIKAAGALTADVITSVGATVAFMASGVKFASDAAGNALAFMTGQSAQVAAFNAISEKNAEAVKAQAKEVSALKKEYDECEEVAQRVSDEIGDETRAREKNTEATKKATEALSKYNTERQNAERGKIEVQLSPLEKQGLAESDLKTINQQIAAAKGRAGGEEALVRLQTQRALKETEILQIKEQVAAEDQRIIDAETEKKTAAAEVAARYQTNLDLLDLELAILNAQASGHDKKAKQLEHERDVQAETARIVEATGLAYDDAARKAEQLVSAKEKADNRGKDGNGERSKIHGYSQEQGGTGEARTRAEGRMKDSRKAYTDSISDHMGMSGMSASRLTPRSDGVGARTPATDAVKPSGDSELATLFKAYSDKTVEIFEKALA